MFEILKDVEFDDTVYIVEALKQQMNCKLKVIEQSSYIPSGKYLFRGWFVVKDDKGLCYKVVTEMFGNNPRDDYQYIKVIDFNKVNRVKVTAYIWEVVK